MRIRVFEPAKTGEFVLYHSSATLYKLDEGEGRASTPRLAAFEDVSAVSQESPTSNRHLLQLQACLYLLRSNPTIMAYTAHAADAQTLDDERRGCAQRGLATRSEGVESWGGGSNQGCLADALSPDMKRHWDETMFSMRVYGILFRIHNMYDMNYKSQERW